MRTGLRGASLLEGLVAVAVTALLATLAPAGLSAWAAGQRLQAMAAQLETELQHARALAVARNQLVRLGLPDAASCCTAVQPARAGARQTSNPSAGPTARCCAPSRSRPGSR